MGYRSTTIHRFACDEDECRNRIYIEVRSKTYARRLLKRETGFSEPEYGAFKCSDHNTKEPVDDLRHYITRECPQRPIY